jgi:hypothetical protein
VRYLAGHDWRLLGTYNALDAQRVFRFGQALGRRFVRVPILSPTPERFAAILATESADVGVGVQQGIATLYECHRARPATELGPALFLRMVDYIRAGTDTAAEVLRPTDDTTPTPVTATDDVPRPVPEPAPVPSMDPIDRELFAEAYLVNVGTWLQQMDQVSELGTDIVSRGVLSPAEWNWVVESSRVLA